MSLAPWSLLSILCGIGWPIVATFSALDEHTSEQRNWLAYFLIVFTIVLPCHFLCAFWFPFYIELEILSILYLVRNNASGAARFYDACLSHQRCIAFLLNFQLQDVEGMLSGMLKKKNVEEKEPEESLDCSPDMVLTD